MELIIVACLVGAPQECREHRLLLDIDGLDAAQCVYSSPPRVAQWASLHPQWKVTGWRCFKPRPEKFV